MRFVRRIASGIVPVRVNHNSGIGITVDKPIPPFTGRVPCQEPPSRWIVVTVPQKLEATVAIFLIANISSKPKRALGRT